MSLYPPLFFNRIILNKVSDDFLEIEVLVKKSLFNRNLQGSIFGGSLYAAADPYPAVQYWNALREHGIKCQAWLKKSEVEYLKPSTTSIRLNFKISKEELEKAIQDLNTHGRHEAWNETVGFDTKGEVTFKYKSLTVLKFK